MGSKLYSKPTDALRNVLTLLKSEDHDWFTFYESERPESARVPYVTIEQIGGQGYPADTTVSHNFKNIIIVHLYCLVSSDHAVLDYVDDLYDMFASMHSNNMNPPNMVNYQYIEQVRNIEHWQFTLEFTG